MSEKSNFNWQVRTAALSIFLLGFVAGALAFGAYNVWFGASAKPTRQQRYEKIFDELSLSDSQKTDVQKVIGETKIELENFKKEGEPKYLEIRSRADGRFKQIMSPEQWNKFETLREELKNQEGYKK